MGNQWHFDAESYLAMVRSEIPTYDDLQSALADATRDVPARRILDLGSGTGVTAQNVLAAHPGAELTGVDGSDTMLAHARALLPTCDFLVADLTDPLPQGPFDLVVSAFAVHHLPGPAKADLFARVAAVLAPGGRLALLDVVVPVASVEHPVPLDEGIDVPSTLEDQIGWLRAAGLEPQVVLAHDDLAIVTADR